MPFQKGHKFHPPKDPDAIPGRSRAIARRIKNLAVAVNEAIEPAVFVQYWLAVASNNANVRLAEDEDGDLFVTWDDAGPTPTQAERDNAIRELTNRGHGQAPQSHYIEKVITAHISATSVDHRALAEKTPMLAMLGAWRAAKGELPASPAQGHERGPDQPNLASVIDAESTEVPTSQHDQAIDQPAGGTIEPASED